MPKDNKLKQIQTIAMILGMLGCVSGMYASVKSFDNRDDDKDILIESRIVRIETKMDLLLEDMKQIHEIVSRPK